MNHRMFYYALFMLFFSASCHPASDKSGQGASAKNPPYDGAMDTIHAFGIPTPQKGDSCMALANRFHEKFGVLISDYYVVLDSLSIQLNQDSRMDRLLVLSPMSLEYDTRICPQDQNPKRLLVELIQGENGVKVRRIHANLISDVGGVLSHYNGISLTAGGFEIVHQAGARYYWTHKMIFSANKDSITLKRVEKTCGFEERERKGVWDADKGFVYGIRISDTLKNNCHCDESWKALEAGR